MTQVNGRHFLHYCLIYLYHEKIFSSESLFFTFVHLFYVIYHKWKQFILNENAITSSIKYFFVARFLNGLLYQFSCICLILNSPSLIFCNVSLKLLLNLSNSCNVSLKLLLNLRKQRYWNYEHIFDSESDWDCIIVIQNSIYYCHRNMIHKEKVFGGYTFKCKKKKWLLR